MYQFHILIQVAASIIGPLILVALAVAGVKRYRSSLEQDGVSVPYTAMSALLAATAHGVIFSYLVNHSDANTLLYVPAVAVAAAFGLLHYVLTRKRGRAKASLTLAYSLAVLVVNGYVAFAILLLNLQF